MENPKVFEKICDDLLTGGYGLMRGAELDVSRTKDEYLLQQAAKWELQADPAPGNRWRAHSKMELAQGVYSVLPPSPYMQRYEDNPDAGGMDREFRPIAPSALSSQTLAYLLERNEGIARVVEPRIFDARRVRIGLHLVSYRPQGKNPSYAAPMWFHRDTEEFVAVVLLGLSRNLGGGENAISPRDPHIETMINLEDPLDMLLLTRRTRHAVLPMRSLDGRPAHRDVLLITFGDGSTAH